MHTEQNSTLVYQSSIMKLVYRQQKNKKDVDLNILSGDKSVFVHSLVLQLGSSFLASLLDSSCDCSRPNSLVVHSVYSEVLHYFVSFLYTGCTPPMSNTNARSLQSLIKELGFNSGVCEEFHPRKAFK